MKDNPIGVFDSGVGGLSVLRSIRQRLPDEDLIYVADMLYVPYGDKPQQVIEERALAISHFLLDKGVKAIVVACNTATVTAIKKLRQLISIPIIGIEPGVKPASLTTQSGTIGVLATSRTLQSKSFSILLQNWVMQHQVELQACPGLVEQVENLDLFANETRNLLTKYLQPLLSKGADTIVLGCTHYPFLMPLINEICAGQARVIDTGPAVAREVERRLQVENLLNRNDIPGKELFCCSTKHNNTESIMSSLWGSPVNLKVMDQLESIMSGNEGSASISQITGS